MEIKFGNRKPMAKIKGAAISGITFKAILEASDQAIAANPTLPFNPFAITRKIKWENVKLYVAIHRKGKKTIVCNDNCYELASCTVDGNNSDTYKDVRYPTKVFIDNENGTQGTITIEVNFPRILVVDGADYIEVLVDAQTDAIGKMDYIPPSFEMVDGQPFVATALEDVGDYWAKPRESVLVVEPIYEHSQHTMDVIPIMSVITLDNLAKNFDENIGENVTNIQLLNYDTHYLPSYHIINSEKVRLVSSVRIKSEQKDISLDYRNLTYDHRTSVHDDDVARYRYGHDILYDDPDKDLDSCILDVTFSQNGKRNTGDRSVIYVESYVSSGELIKESMAKEEMVRKQNTYKIIKQNNAV